jgi:RNA polymerase sigma factor for flagellar operon FliA
MKTKAQRRTTTSIAFSSSLNWSAFGKGDESARRTILEENLPIVHHVARQLEKKLSSVVDHDELVSAGTTGLMTAAEHFDPDRGLAFTTFAVPRIRGSMLDELRRQDQVPRSVRSKIRRIKMARHALATTLCRRPNKNEIATVLDISPDTLWKWELDIEGAIKIPIDRPRTHVTHGGDERPIEFTFIATNHRMPIDQEFERFEDATLIRDAIYRMKEQERTVLRLHFYEDLTQSDIAEILGLSNNRISQIKAKALSRLRGKIGHLLRS